MRNEVGLDRGVLGVSTTFGIHECESVYSITRPEPVDALADGRNRSSAVGAEHIRKLRIELIVLGETPFAFKRIPLADASRFNVHENFVRPYLWDRKRLELEGVEATPLINSNGFHCFRTCIC